MSRAAVLTGRNGSKMPVGAAHGGMPVFLKRRGSEPPPLEQWEKRYDPWAIKAPLSQSCDDLTRPSATAQGCVIFVFGHDQFSRCGLLCSTEHKSLVQRSKRLLRWDGGYEFVEVPFTLQFLGFFDFEKIGWMNFSAVRLNDALAKERIVRGDFLHFGDHFRPIMRIVAHCDQSLEIMTDRRVDTRLKSWWAFRGVSFVR